jgi:hypothetical protein
MRTALERAVAAAGERTLLISGEDMGALKEAELVRLREYFQSRFDALLVVGYVRPPAGFMTSGFQQRLKGAALERLDLDREYRNYQRSFAKFDAAFGPENVHLWKFDPAAFPGGCAVRDFCSRLGIPLPGERIIRQNESLSREAVALLYTYRKLGRRFGATILKGPESQRLGELLAERVGNRKFRFSPAVIAPVLANNRADIEWMEARLGASLREELGDPQPGDVRDEADLMNPGAEAVSRLRILLGDAMPAGATGETPEEVARLVHALRKTRAGTGETQEVAEDPAGGASSMPGRRGAAPLKLADMIGDIRRADPALLEGMADGQAEALVRNVFEHINGTLAGSEERVVAYAGLGRFQVRKAQRPADAGTASRTQIVFRRAEAGRRRG